MRFELIDGELLVLNGGGGELYRLVGPAAEAMQAARAGVDPEGLAEHLVAPMAALVDAGLVCEYQFDRRRVMQAGSAAALTGVFVLALPDRAAAASVVPSAPPPPTLLWVTVWPGTDSFTRLTFIPNPDNGGSPILNYQVNIGDPAVWYSGSPVFTTSPYQWAGVATIGQGWKMRAVNAVGPGNVGGADGGGGSNTVPVTTVPNAPVIQTVALQSLKGVVTFTQAPDAVNAPITNYKYSINGAAFVLLTPADTLSTVLVGNVGTNVAVGNTIRLVAVNLAGDSVPSNSVAVVSYGPVFTALVVSAVKEFSSNPKFVNNESVRFTTTGVGPNAVTGFPVNSVSYYRRLHSLAGAVTDADTLIGTSTNPGNNWQVDSVIPLATEGAYRVAAVIFDNAGNKTTTADQRVTVDFTAPSGPNPTLDGGL